MFERYTEKARRVIFFSRYEASEFGSPYIETEHLLLGLLRENAANLSRHASRPINAEEVRIEIARQISVHEKSSTSVDLPISDECKRILAYANEEAERLGHKHIRTGHLLLGILCEKDCLAARMLRDRGFDLDRARKSIDQDPGEYAAASGAGGGMGMDSGSVSFSSQHMADVALVEISPTELMLTYHRGVYVPRVGEKISLLEEGAESRHYQIEDITWEFRSSEGTAQLKNVRFKVARVDG